MYEQNEVPVFRRILWIVLWFIVIIAVLWVLVWLIFFRHSDKKTSITHQPTTTQHQPTGTTKQPSSSNSGTTPAPSTPTPAPSTSPATSTAPSELVNTGAGNVVVPFVAASLAGSTLYYVRTRKKLLS